MLNRLQKYSLLLFTGLLFLAFISCMSKKERPDAVLPIDEMADALTVVYISEVRAIQTYDLKTQKDEFLRRYLYPEIFDSLGITDSVFFLSYDFYESRPKDMEALMDSVITRIAAVPIDSVRVREKNDTRTLDDKYKEIEDLEAFKRRQKEARRDPRR